MLTRSLDAEWGSDEFVVLNKRELNCDEYSLDFYYNNIKKTLIYYHKHELTLENFSQPLLEYFKNGIIDYEFSTSKNLYRRKIWFKNGQKHRISYPACLVWCLNPYKLRFADWIENGKSIRSIQRTMLSETLRIYDRAGGRDLTQEEIDFWIPFCDE